MAQLEKRWVTDGGPGPGALSVRKRLLLVEPPFYRLYGGGLSLVKFPLAMGYLSGAVLARTTWEVVAANLDFDPRADAAITFRHLAGKGYTRYLRSLQDPRGGVWAETEAILVELRPTVLGISSKTQNFASVRIVADIAKRIDPSILVVVGGPHPSMVGAAVLDHPNIDVAAIGEGEETLVDLLRTIEQGGDLSRVDGIVFRRGGATVKTAPRAYIEDLDALPWPHTVAPKVLRDFALYPKAAFRHLFAIRGCPYGCEFCGSREIWTRKARFRSARNVVDEIHSLRAAGLTHVHFDDDTFGVRSDYIRALCRLLKSECEGLTWSCEITVNLVKEELIREMVEAGCIDVQVGVESGNNGILKKVHKNTTVQEAHAAVGIMKRHGLYVQAFFMAGFPYETEETLLDTWRTINTIEADHIIFSIFTPYPGTDAFEICRQAGLVDDTYDVSLYNHQSPQNCFTPHIPRERFAEIIHAMMREIERRNLISKLRHLRRSARNHGMVGLAQKVVRNLRHRMLPTIS